MAPRSVTSVDGGSGAGRAADLWLGVDPVTGLPVGRPPAGTASEPDLLDTHPEKSCGRSNGKRNGPLWCVETLL